MTQKLQKLTARLIIPTLCLVFAIVLGFFPTDCRFTQQFTFHRCSKKHKELVVVLEMSLSMDIKPTFKQNLNT